MARIVYGTLASMATDGVYRGMRDMNEVEKMDCRANGEVIFYAMSPPLLQGPNISDQSEGRTDRKKKWGRYPIIQAKNNEWSWQGYTEYK